MSVIYVHDNQIVKKNTPLFSLDDRPYKIAIGNAMSQLASARLQVQAIKATYQQRLADLKKAEQSVIYEQREFDRQKKLAASGIASTRQLDKATHMLQNASQHFAAAQQQLASVLARLNNNVELPIDDHPLVQRAQAQLNLATLNLSYTVIKAPFNGIVAKVTQLQPGDYIKEGEPVFALLSNKDIWIEANFRGTDMTHMHPGQSAKIDIDIYPNKTLTGTVLSSSPGTGSSFSLLPPENATGNWVKIVQDSAR